MRIDISSDDLISALLRLSETGTVCVLDSCGKSLLEAICSGSEFKL